MSKKNNNGKETILKELEIIKKFAKEMGYNYFIDEYDNCENGRPMLSIELNGTSDSEGNPYSWAWYTDTYNPYEGR